MATPSSQLFGNWLSNNIGGLNKDWSAVFKTPLNTTQTLPVKPEAIPGVVSGYMNSPVLDAIRGEKDDYMRSAMLTDYLRRRGAQEDIENLPAIFKTIRDQQYEDRLKSRPLEFQELVAKNLLKTITDLPGQVMRAGRMYDKEALEAGASLANRPRFQDTIRYFA